MKIDANMMRGFREGEAAGGAGAHYRDNPYFYTSAMSDAWEMGRRLVVTRARLDIAQIVGLSTRGLTCGGARARTLPSRSTRPPSTSC